MHVDDLYELYLKNPFVSTDSRYIKKGSMFFALKGENFDGNTFASSALKKGASYAIIDNKDYYTDNGKIILVDDVLTTLQKLANYHRSKFNFPVLAITGTNGKTTTKELVYRVLSEKYKTVATQGNFNNQIGLPLTLLSVDKDNTEFCIVEMGANHISDILELCEIADPDYGLITCVGIAHLEGFKTFENIVKAKTELYKWVQNKGGINFVNADDEILLEYASKGKVITYGSDKTKKHYYYCYGKPKKGNINVSFTWTFQNEHHKIDSELYGKYNFLNMLAAVCIGSYFNVQPNKINDALISYKPSNNRSEIRKTENNTYICDAYNANPSSMLNALDTFENLDTKNKIVILGDMFELGSESLNEHKKIVEKLTMMDLHQVILIGKYFAEASKDTNFTIYNNMDDALKDLNLENYRNMTFLIKGSRRMSLERLLR
ncbi:MAG: UDP-N-acetylmuramoyl-tripeptide--D-alanyl-D-alanine ligase [Bacteroidales bacterium]|jgi:UDP-N-acetylmuramoyl-tripeptide--D-alanyl-D-alanine ligase